MSESSLFWDEYKIALKDRLVPGIPVPDHQEIFALPFSNPFTSATEPLSAEAVNFLIFGLADTTLSADGSKGAYASELNTYLNTVDEDTLLDPEAKEKLDEAEAMLVDAEADLEKARQNAEVVYQTIPDPKPEFELWLLSYPPYTTAVLFRNSVKGMRDQAYNAYWGRVETLREYQTKLAKALDTDTSYPTFNMRVQDGSTETFTPTYFATGLRDQLNNWIQGSGVADRTLFEVKVDSGIPPAGLKDQLSNWIYGRGVVERASFEFKGDLAAPAVTADGGIYLKFIIQAIGRFDLEVGSWDVPGVKTLYPNRVPDAPDVLNPKFALPISALIAYAPRLEVEYREGGGEVKLLSTIAPAAAENEPYATVLGVLGQHFPES